MKSARIDQRALRSAIVSCWLERLYTTEAQAALRHARHAQEDNGDAEASRLARVAVSCRARTLAVLRIPRAGAEERWVRDIARKQWIP